MAAFWGRSTALLDVLPQHHRAVLEESLERQRREVAQVGAVLGAVLRGDGATLRAALGDLHPGAVGRSTALVLVAKLFEELRLLSSERYLAGLDTSASALPPYLELLLPRFPPSTHEVLARRLRWLDATLRGGAEEHHVPGFLGPPSAYQFEALEGGRGGAVRLVEGLVASWGAARM